MRPIRIRYKNARAVCLALDKVNGMAEAHCYTSWPEVADVSLRAEDKVLALVGSTKQAVGASVVSTSGEEVTRAYVKHGHTRVATRVTLERRATGWFLVDVARAEIYMEGGGADRITLTPYQSAQAVKRLKATYTVND